jgi:predicted Zn-dependent peptidase
LASLSSLSGSFERALGLASQAVLRPRFDPKEWERVQRLTVAAREQEADDPGELARKIGLRLFFGLAHPYGLPVSGTPETVRRLALSDLRAAHALVVRPENAALFVAGNLPEAEVRRALERAFGGWRSAGAPPAGPVSYPAPENDKLRVVIVDRPGAVQTVVRFVMPAPPYDDPARERLLSLGTVLGGSFTSRLNANLREAKGYTYGASASYSLAPAVGYLIAGADVRADVTGASLREFLEEFRKIRAGDVSEAEATKAASTRRQEAIESVSSLGGLIAVAADLYVSGRPFSGLAEDLRILSALRAADLNGTANSGIPLERGLLVLVGDKKTILPQLQGLGLPEPVEVKG